MCGRYRLSRRKQILEEHFDVVAGTEDWNPRYNIAPTQLVPIIRQKPKEPVRELSLFRWGLVPRWAKDSSVAAKMINARSETASTKPAFSDALKSRRCLVLADGFYEWQKTGKVKQPYCFEINDGELFAFCGDMGPLERCNRKGFGDLLDINDDGKRRYVFGSRPNASHPKSRQLRFLARSGHEGRCGGVRIVEALRWSADAMLSRKQ
jgi:hypothetical protein